jgi:CRISPR-associated protein Cas1
MCAMRDRPQSPGVEALRSATVTLGQHLDSLRDGIPLDGLRGIEGNAARIYFAVFDELITQQKEAFFFRERSRRPPLDNVNALLSFLYTLLRHDCESALESVGLDPLSVSSIATGPGVRAWRSISWRNSVPSSPTAWRSP